VKTKKQKGFTIIEAVVATGVFAVVVSSSLGVYLATVRLDSKSRAERTVQQNARFIMDFIAKEVRNGSINYAGSNDTDTLSIINQQNEPVVINWNGASDPNLSITKTGVGSTILNSNEVRITNAAFYVYPGADPFVLSNDVHVQPHVTVILKLESTNASIQEGAEMSIQSTFAVRQYPTRQ
jgi:Tfp pilus assembly protein PilW